MPRKNHYSHFFPTHLFLCPSHLCPSHLCHTHLHPSHLCPAIIFHLCPSYVCPSTYAPPTSTMPMPLPLLSIHLCPSHLYPANIIIHLCPLTLAPSSFPAICPPPPPPIYAPLTSAPPTCEAGLFRWRVHAVLALAQSVYCCSCSVWRLAFGVCLSTAQGSLCLPNECASVCTCFGPNPSKLCSIWCLGARVCGLWCLA